MIRVLLLISLFFIMLQARENPFFPVQSAQDISLTSNQVIKLPMLKRAALTLPSTARTIESVTVTYKNLDGSIAHKTVVIQNAIDWHLPIFISQNYNESNSMLSNQKQMKKERVKAKYEKVASLKFVSFFVKKNRLKILTKDKLLRHFLLAKPHRIVCDFKRETDIGRFVKNLKEGSLFTKIRVGTHKGYYRVVIELDGYYSYKLDYIRSGYIITLL